MIYDVFQRRLHCSVHCFVLLHSWILVCQIEICKILGKSWDYQNEVLRLRVPIPNAVVFRRLLIFDQALVGKYLAIMVCGWEGSFLMEGGAYKIWDLWREWFLKEFSGPYRVRLRKKKVFWEWGMWGTLRDVKYFKIWDSWIEWCLQAVLGP